MQGLRRHGFPSALGAGSHSNPSSRAVQKGRESTPDFSRRNESTPGFAKSRHHHGAAMTVKSVKNVNNPTPTRNDAITYGVDLPNTFSLVRLIDPVKLSELVSGFTSWTLFGIGALDATIVAQLTKIESTVGATLDFADDPSGGPQRRLYQREQTLYWSDALAALPFGQA